MTKWIEVTDLYGSKIVLNVANIQGYAYNRELNEYTYYCGPNIIPVSGKMHEEIMDAVDEYCDEFEKLVGVNEGSNEGNKEVVVQNTNGLDSRDIRYKILNADFMSAEQKLKLIVALNI